jgi:small GTP-binding protein
MNEPGMKVVMLGDSGVGKTAIVNRMAAQRFPNHHMPTIGSQFVEIRVSVEGVQIPIHLWDTAGQEAYQSLVGYYSRESKGAVVVFDVTSEKSFDSIPKWLTFIRGTCPSVKIVLFANKVDQDGSRVMSSSAIREFAAVNQLNCLEGSARTGQNVHELFDRLGEELAGDISARLMEEDTNVININQKGTGNCCRGS